MFVLPPAQTGTRPKRARRRNPRWLIALGVTLALVLFVGAALLAGGLLRHHSPKKLQAASSPHTSTTTKKSPFSCAGGSWPSLYQGEPRTLAKPTNPGVFLWNDAKGWHVRAVDPAGSTSFTIQITTSAPIASYSVKTTPAALPKASVAGNHASITFTGGADPRGFDFALCESSEFRFNVSTKTGTWSPDHTWLGLNGTAIGNQIVIDRST